jgi:hypothetical protein
MDQHIIMGREWRVLVEATQQNRQIVNADDNSDVRTQ